MATAKDKETTFHAGPFRRVRTTANPYDDYGDDTLAAATNCYFQDPVSGGGVFARPGATNPVSVTGIASGGMYCHIGLDGTVYNFVVSGDGSAALKIYRWASMGASVTDVTPTNIVLPVTGNVYFTSLNGEMIVSDGVDKMWRATSLSSTPIVATVIEQQTPATALSIGSNDVRLANTAFTYTGRASPILGTQATFAANATGTAVGALGQIAIGTWGIILVELNSSAALVFTAAFNAGAGYATEALAIAALPARTATRWYVGYVTMRADGGAVWIAGTDAFAGGSTGNQAQTTNYYAGEGPAYSVFGQPVIYYGAVFVIYQQVEATYARTTIGWSEPNEPGVGYQQTDYDNQWTLTQTSAFPLYVLVPTNGALYYSRELGWGVVAGAPGINFQGTATHDIVAGNVGCTNPAAAVRYLNYIYFADQSGRPWRMAVGGKQEPIWQQVSSLFEVSQFDSGQAGFSLIEPNLNVYLQVYIAPDTTRSLLVFDAVTGNYEGTWVVGGTSVLRGAILRDGTSTANGGPSLGLMTFPPVSTIPLWKLATVYDAVWKDNNVTMDVSVSTGKLGYGAKRDRTYREVRAVSVNSAATPALTLAVATSQQSVSAAAGSVLASPPESTIYRTVWPLENVSGRDAALTIVPTTTTAQFRLFRVEVDAVEGADVTVLDH